MYEWGTDMVRYVVWRPTGLFPEQFGHELLGLLGL